jgi:hypothetical protein
MAGKHAKTDWEITIISASRMCDPNWTPEPCEARSEVHDPLQGLWDFLKWVKWTETNWLGTALVFDKPQPWNGEWPRQTTKLYYEPGGILLEHEKRWKALAKSGDDVEIRGMCVSACTLITAYIPKERLCFGEHATLMFHQVRIPKQGAKQGVKDDLSFENTMPYLLGTQQFVARLPRDILMWIKERGGAEGLPGDTPYHFLTLYAGELWNMGYRKCEEPEEPEELPVPMTVIKSTKIGTGG